MFLSALIGQSSIKHVGIMIRGLLIVFCTLNATGAAAAEYPTKTIQIINPFPPGAVTDIVARIAGPKLSTILGQRVIIMNKSGGGGAVGIQAAKDAVPDGYTILVTPPPILLIPLVNKSSGFTMKDFAPLVLATSSPNTTVVKADAPWKTLEDFIADAKKNPDSLTYGSAGPGTTPHFIGELVKLKTKIDLTHVPLGSESAAATALIHKQRHNQHQGIQNRGAESAENIDFKILCAFSASPWHVLFTLS